MRKKAFLILIVFVSILLLIFRNNLFYHLQIYLLKDHLSNSVPCTTVSKKLQNGFCKAGFYSKVWAHRVDSYERFVFLSKSFSGLEVDLVYDSAKNIFDVGHPPAESIGLSFETFLRDNAAEQKYFWLDLKNLSGSNATSVLQLLNRLDLAYHIRGRVIVESGDIVSLSKISAAGYFTSFYYDTNLYEEFLKSAPLSGPDSIFSTIDAVSIDVLSYDTLLRRFPEKPRLTWALSSTYYLSDSMFSSLDNDKKLLIYLVNIKSPGYR